MNSWAATVKISKATDVIDNQSNTRLPDDYVVMVGDIVTTIYLSVHHLFISANYSNKLIFFVTEVSWLVDMYESQLQPQIS